MTKNVTGGKKTRKQGRGNSASTFKRPMLWAEDMQLYAHIETIKGDGRFDCLCSDQTTRIGHIRGKLRRRVWITRGDIVLVCKREFDDGVVDIIHKYNKDEIQLLVSTKEFILSTSSQQTTLDSSGIEFSSEMVEDNEEEKEEGYTDLEEEELSDVDSVVIIDDI